MAVDLNAADNGGGTGLGAVEYSFDGGTNWTRADPAGLPLRFTAPGSGFIHLIARAEDRAGNWAVNDSRFFIETPCPNQAPVADGGSGYTGAEGAPITLDGGASRDADGRLILFEWDLDGDGAFDDATGSRVDATFGDNGVFDVALRVTDDKLGRATATTKVTVSNAPPVVEAGDALAVAPNAVLRLAQARVRDPGVDDTLSVTVSWGDGTPSTKGEVAEGRIVAAHRFAAVGAYTAEVCATDDDGARSCDTLGITVAQPKRLLYLPLTRR